jgi:hypothetical protein
MASPLPTYADARRALLEVLAKFRAGHDREFGRGYVLEEAHKALGQFGDQHGGRLLMAAYDDLYRSGVINTGRALNQPGPEWGHLSEHGVETLKNVDRDPSNARGYLKAIEPHLKGQDIGLSYLAEALDTYNKGSVKAAAVMLGCTVEALSLSLRDRLKAKITSSGGSAPPQLDDWRIAAVLRALQQQIDGRVSAMPRDLRERYESFWTAWTGLFRMSRNDAGHPKSIEPVTREAVHGQLLLLHEHARLVLDLGAWIDSAF